MSDKKLIAINLSKDETIAALVEYATRNGKILYRGQGVFSAILFQECGHLKQVRVEVEYSEPEWQEKEP